MALDPTHLPIDRIIVTIRARRDLGDVEGLARSIAEVGLLHPLVIRRDGTLIAGRRRLEACRRLKWTEVPVTIVDLAELRKGEAAENAYRKNFLPTEIAAIAASLWEAETRHARDRQGVRTDLGENVPEEDRGRVRDRVAAFVGISGRTLEKIFAVVNAAAASPAVFGSLPELMDRTSVERAYRSLRKPKPVAAPTESEEFLPDEHPVMQAWSAVEFAFFEVERLTPETLLENRQEILDALDNARNAAADVCELLLQGKR